MPPLEKPTLVQILTDKLREDIQKGAWKGQLPGRRILAERYGCSVKTCLRAIDMLEEEGILSPAVQGRPRSILSPGAAKSTRARRHTLIIIHTSRAPLSAEMANILNELQAIWEGNAGAVVKIPIDYKQLKNPEKRINEIIHRHSVDAAILLNAPLPITRACREHIPCFQMGGLYEEHPNVSSYSSNFKKEIENFARHLVAWGHRRILIPIYDETSRPPVTAGLLDAYGENEAPHDLDSLMPCFFSSEPKEWMALWKEKLSALEPTAVIVMDDVRYLSLTSFCQQAGIRIPRDISVILYNYNPKFEWISPRPTMGQFPAKKVATAFKKWIKSHYKCMGCNSLPISHRWGDSVARIGQQKAK